jgi:hypothetical protein
VRALVLCNGAGQRQSGHAAAEDDNIEVGLTGSGLGHWDQAVKRR